MTYLPSSVPTLQQKDAGILYQIDCCKASSGKTVSVTKRRVRWRFGFANQSAMEQGATGVDCRGYEHEVTFIWSIASGKKLIVHDNKEVHYSQGKREGKFTFMWSAGGSMFTLIAYAAPPVSRTHRAFGKQYELLINNVPFDTLPRIYQLGTGLMKEGTMHARGPEIANTSESYYNRRSVQDEMAWARSMHAMETRRKMNDCMRSDSPASVAAKSNHDHDANVVQVPLDEPQDLISAPISTTSQDLLSEPLISTSGVSVFSFDGYEQQQQQQQPLQQHGHVMQWHAQDEFSPHQPPSYEAIWSSILDAYDNGASKSNPSSPGIGYPHHDMPVMSTSVEQIQSSMQGLSVDTNVASKTSMMLDSPTDVSALDGALQNLVNLDDISQPVLQSYAPSTKHPWEGKEHVPLKDLKKQEDVPKKEVMRTYAAYQQQHPGALVVYGQGQMDYNQQGPPPLSFGYRY